MTTITEAVDALKVAAMKLRDARTKLITAKAEYERAKEGESAARGQYTLAFDVFEEQTGVDL